jgi:hypothetical protein
MLSRSGKKDILIIEEKKSSPQLYYRYMIVLATL